MVCVVYLWADVSACTLHYSKTDATLDEFYGNSNDSACMPTTGQLIPFEWTTEATPTRTIDFFVSG